METAGNKMIGVDPGEGQFPRKFYATFWSYRDDIDAGGPQAAIYSDNQKLYGSFRSGGWTDIPDLRWQTLFANAITREDTFTRFTTGSQQCDGTILFDEDSDFVSMYLDEWIRTEIYLDQGTVGNSDGSWYGKFNLDELTMEQNGHEFRPTVDEDCWINQFLLGQFFRTRIQSIAPNGSKLNQYISDCYVDSTLARIEIGYNIDWDYCTHREIQVISSHSYDEIVFDLRFGSFEATDEVFLFVVTEDDSVNAEGEPLTLE